MCEFDVNVCTESILKTTTKKKNCLNTPYCMPQKEKMKHVLAQVPVDINQWTKKNLHFQRHYYTHNSEKIIKLAYIWIPDRCYYSLCREL